nr:DUF881 domain-containing protein [Allostreptomyces psammosilenae]
MLLLTRLMDHSLDEGYAEAAARRTAAGTTPGAAAGARHRPLLLLGLALVAGVLAAGAARQYTAAPIAEEHREQLMGRVEDETAAADRLQEQVDTVRAEVDAARRAALDGDELQERLALPELLAGATPVTGPGLSLVLDDAEGSEAGDAGVDPRSGTFGDAGRIRDRDLQRVVNGLWQAGAEAVSVNGQRLTALSAIRAAGEAILVDNTPLAPPYTILAIGDGPRVLDGFQTSADGYYLDALRENYRIRVESSVEPELRLPAASSLALRLAEPEAGAGGAVSPAPSASASKR